MGIHPSLKIDSAGVQQRSVLTRIERIKELMQKGLWLEDQEATGLPKTKIVRVKAKGKGKAEKAEGAEGAAAPGAPAAAAGAGAAPGAKK